MRLKEKMLSCAGVSSRHCAGIPAIVLAFPPLCWHSCHRLSYRLDLKQEVRGHRVLVGTNPKL